MSPSGSAASGSMLAGGSNGKVRTSTANGASQPGCA
jgi:hypothetical protein